MRLIRLEVQHSWIITSVFSQPDSLNIKYFAFSSFSQTAHKNGVTAWISACWSHHTEFKFETWSFVVMKLISVKVCGETCIIFISDLLDLRKNSKTVAHREQRVRCCFQNKSTALLNKRFQNASVVWMTVRRVSGAMQISLPYLYLLNGCRSNKKKWNIFGTRSDCLLAWN
jgi:hypothetical protein